LQENRIIAEIQWNIQFGHEKRSLNTVLHSKEQTKPHLYKAAVPTADQAEIRYYTV
jgi:hypothetical protein